MPSHTPQWSGLRDTNKEGGSSPRVHVAVGPNFELSPSQSASVNPKVPANRTSHATKSVTSVPTPPRQYLVCPYSAKDRAKQVGALWDNKSRQWYFIPNGKNENLFVEWMPSSATSKPASLPGRQVVNPYRGSIPRKSPEANKPAISATRTPPPCLS